MLCIFLVVAYPYDRLLEPLRASKKLQSFSVTDSKSTSKQKGDFERTCLFGFFPVKRTFKFIRLVHTHTNSNIITAHSQIFMPFVTLTQIRK